MRKKIKRESDFSRMFLELISKLGEVDSCLRDYGIGMVSPAMMGKYYAFDPSGIHIKNYFRWLGLINCIYAVLNEYGINIKSHGYTYIKDAICIIIDRHSMDICLAKEVYPLIATKYGLKSVNSVEHDIRNAIDAAFSASRDKTGAPAGPMSSFAERPKNKEFILLAAQKVQDMLSEQAQE